MDSDINQNVNQGISPIKKFPVEGTNLSRILTDPQYRQSFHAQLKRFNPLVTAFYKIGALQLFGASRNVMLLTTRGRKSGKLRSTPIGYFRVGGVIYLFSAWGKNTSWFKNMTANPAEIWLQVGLRKFPVTAQVLKEPAEILRATEQLVNESPSAAHTLFGWEPDCDHLDTADFSQIIEHVLVIRFFEKNTNE